jgi:hypothetical protein
MKRLGPLYRSEPRSERKLRVAGEHSHSRSDSGRASPTSPSSPTLSKPTASADHLDGTALTVVLTAQGRSRFDASFNGAQIVRASKNPISDAARVLHGMGYSDHLLLVAQHEGAAHYAMRGSLGAWRKVRIREDRGLRHVAWEAHPRRVGAKKGRRKFKGVRARVRTKNASTTTPGAEQRHSPVAAPAPYPRATPEIKVGRGTA